jgi:hypothetical protein
MEHSVSPQLERLKPLIGEWTMEMIAPGTPPSDLRGRVGFEWRLDFHLVYRQVG